MVVHCGSEHGFSLYYLLQDDDVANTRLRLLQSHVKMEPAGEEDPLQLDAKPNIANIKIESNLE